MHSVEYKKIVWLLASMAIVILAFVYKHYSPTNGYFPRCPFRVLTGLQCPGCGSQRAVHHLLNGEIHTAFQENPLLVLSIPYLLLGVLFEWYPRTDTRWLLWRKRLLGPLATKIILGIVIAFWIGRNIISFL